MNTLLTNHNRLGHYRVGNSIILNKADAFIEASSRKETVNWNFNDDIFSSIDWRIPINTPLAELYRQRAQQLRDKYDHLSLFFSGGVDSGNVLHSFIDNNILLDEIVMYRPKTLESTFNTRDTSNCNLYSEIEFAAIPHLRKYVKDIRTKIRIIDMDYSSDRFLNNDNLVSQFQTLNIYQPSGMARLAMCLDDPIWNEYSLSGKNSCHIHGIDKPIIKLENNQYSFQFIDTSVAVAMMPVPKYHTSLTEMIDRHQSHELFYWTPDLPQLVIKQCQIFKMLGLIPEFRMLFEKSDRLSQDKLTALYPFIYPPHVMSLRDAFCTQKNGMDLFAGQQSWFYDKMPEYAKGQFLYMVKNMQDTIDTRFFRGINNTNYYLEDPDLGSPKIALRTVKSKEYIL